MRVLDLIERKRDGNKLTKDELTFLLSEYMGGRMPDYQMASFLMAIYFQELSDEELLTFTELMRDSGEHIIFDGLHKFLVDKHSTGGVGDKVTVVLTPILAALNMCTAKISGKGLGHTGGTIDKFESIKGFQFSRTPAELVNIAQKTGIGLMGQSEKLVPLDKDLYALRDVTATVASIPLIAASIMSKKLAVQSDCIILDVKVGNGAFMKDLNRAEELAQRMLTIGSMAGRKTSAILSSMEEPLGFAVGNACEIQEAINCLQGNFPDDLKLVVYTLAGIALKSKGDVSTIEEAFPLIDNVISSGEAFNRFKSFILESGGNTDFTQLPQPKFRSHVIAVDDGVVCSIHAEDIGKVAMILGAGRAVKDAMIDHAAGLILHKKVGDTVKKGDILAELLYNNEKNAEIAYKMTLNSYNIKHEEISKQSPILKIIES
ncbi:MAG: thymidine phosphorylase [Brevinema sp.]